MAVQAVTLNLPETVYERIRRTAEKIQRPINEIMIEAVAAVAPVIDTTTTNLRSELAQMAYLNVLPCGKRRAQPWPRLNVIDLKPCMISNSDKV